MVSPEDFERSLEQSEMSAAHTEAEIAIKAYLDHILGIKRIRTELDKSYRYIEAIPQIVDFHSIGYFGEAVGKIGPELTLGDLVIGYTLVVPPLEEEKKPTDNIYDSSERITKNFAANTGKYLVGATLEIDCLFAISEDNKVNEALLDEGSTIAIKHNPDGGLDIKTNSGYSIAPTHLATLVELLNERLHDFD